MIQEGFPTMRKEGFPGGQRPFPAPYTVRCADGRRQSTTAGHPLLFAIDAWGRNRQRREAGVLLAEAGAVCQLGFRSDLNGSFTTTLTPAMTSVKALRTCSTALPPISPAPLIAPVPRQNVVRQASD